LTGGARRVDDAITVVIRSRAAPCVAAGRILGAARIIGRLAELVGTGSVPVARPIEQRAPSWRRFGAIRRFRTIHALTSCRWATAETRGDQGTVSHRLLASGTRRFGERKRGSSGHGGRERDDWIDRCAGSARHRFPLFHIDARLPSRFGLARPLTTCLTTARCGGPGPGQRDCVFSDGGGSAMPVCSGASGMKVS
jgi:hypothetical protein